MESLIKNSSGERLDYTFQKGTGAHTKEGWLIVLGHGVTGNKDRPVITDTAAALNDVGVDTLAFSFSGNGDSEGAFTSSTITKEVGDLDAVLSSVTEHYPNIAYVGHSMGGAVGVIKASHDARIKALVSIAGMVDVKSFALTEFGEETPDAGLMWEEEECPLSSGFMSDLCETIVHLEPLINAVKVPWLLLHGTADDVVLPRDTHTVKELMGEAVNTVFIDGADHSFNKPQHKSKLTERITDWIREI